MSKPFIEPGYRPDDQWASLEHLGEVARYASRIGKYMPTLEEKHMLALVVDEFLRFAEQLRLVGYLDLLEPLQPVFEGLSGCFDFGGQADHGFVGADGGDAVGKPDDSVSFGAGRVGAESAVGEFHSAVSGGHDSSSSVGGVCGKTKPTEEEPAGEADRYFQLLQTLLCGMSSSGGAA